jgi:L,D-peptidoglycan transpeptidase YkuD (ErfK/YbiS/YcfS/YnhG family)
MADPLNASIHSSMAIQAALTNAVRTATAPVDDPSSPAYNTIVTRAAIGSKIHGEDMRGVGLYRNGLVVDYPTDAARKDGSCIFIHIWRGSDRGTVGCIALTEEKVETLQAFADDGAVIAILPDTARARFGSCLPEAAATLPP